MGEVKTRRAQGRGQDEREIISRAQEVNILPFSLLFTSGASSSEEDMLKTSWPAKRKEKYVIGSAVLSSSRRGACSLLRVR